MGLKQSIVVVNEYSVKTPTGGSRGGTPGAYILDYMLRDDAVERVAPAKLMESDSFAKKFEDCLLVSNSMDSIPEFKRKVKKSQKKGGTAFGYGEVSLSDERVRSIAKEFQTQFDYNKKTVIKTVLSFDEKYLREHGLIDEDFVFKKEGDYEGHVDQLKLRMAIMHGLNRMAKSFDDLCYIGSIQVDTGHVHCHLAMMDRGRGRIMPDGTQRGKLSANQMKILRRGMDNFLDQKQHVKSLSNAIMYEKRNLLCYVKKIANKTMLSNGFTQFLLACLPENKNLWRASTNRKEMRKSNAIVREYVLGLFGQPGSGYRNAMSEIFKYADYRKKREDLSNQEYNKLVRTGQSDLIERCMNGVYDVLKKIPQERLQVQTPMLDVMSMDYESMAGSGVNDPIVEFGFKLRSYVSRMRHHRDEYHKYREEYKNYESVEDKSDDAVPLGHFLRLERDYHAMLMTKYQYFLPFTPEEDNVQEQLYDLTKDTETLINMQNMRNDKMFQRLNARDADVYGLKVYGQYGGGKIKSFPQVMDRRIEQFSEKVQKKAEAFREVLQDHGMGLKNGVIVKSYMYDFDRVKALDLHHLGYDFPYDADISKLNIDRFAYMANLRYQSFEAAKDYLERSGQQEAVNVFAVKDILFMKQFADRISTTGVLPTVRSDSGSKRRAKTISLDDDYTSDINMMIRSVIESVSDLEHI